MKYYKRPGGRAEGPPLLEARTAGFLRRVRRCQARYRWLCATNHWPKVCPLRAGMLGSGLTIPVMKCGHGLLRRPQHTHSVVYAVVYLSVSGW